MKDGDARHSKLLFNSDQMLEWCLVTWQGLSEGQKEVLWDYVEDGLDRDSDIDRLVFGFAKSALCASVLRDEYRMRSYANHARNINPPDD